jgi:hypothetical protein
MKRRSPLTVGLVALLSWVIAIPPGVAAQAQAAQRAGEVSRMVPQVKIVRGSQQITGAQSTPVDWGDLVNTQRDGRARITLDDGSLLNVGSNSSLKVTQYVPGAQQSTIDLTYGRLRSNVAKITQPGGKFEVHTPVGVAGVVGTDFFLSFENNVLQLIVYDGAVRFCNLAGVCVLVAAGFISIIRGNNQPPSQPTQATPMELTEAANSTEVGGGVVTAGLHTKRLAIVAVVIALAVPKPYR